MSEGTIEYPTTFYKADQRASTLNDNQRSYATFDGAIAGKSEFGSLLHVDDVFLQPRRDVIYKHEPGLQQVILTLVGTVAYNDATLKNKYVSPEEALFLNKTSGSYSLHNPYENETINYLRIGIKRNSTSLTDITNYPIAFKQSNQLIGIHPERPNEPFFASIGVYQGRAKGSYTLKQPGNGVFAYIINGAFELEERLMEHRDGLGLWDVDIIQFEALSEFAILLLIETPLHTN